MISITISSATSTRYDVRGPQAQMVGFMRSLFRERLTNAMPVHSGFPTQVYPNRRCMKSDENFQLLDRAIELLDAANGEIEGLIRQAGAGRYEPKDTLKAMLSRREHELPGGNPEPV